MGKKLTKRQISFICSVAFFAISGAYVFISDAIKAWKDTSPTLIETSELDHAGEIIHSVGEELGNASPVGFDENALNALDSADTSGIIVRVVDGDTYCIDLENVKGDEEKGTKVRIIGVDTPESVAPAEYRKDNTEEGKTVSDVVKSKLKEGSTVLVEFDAQREDKYGRTLAYVYMSDGKMVEDWLLESGLANVATYPPNVKYADHFQELAHEAWENKVGLWADFFKEEPTEKTK